MLKCLVMVTLTSESELLSCFRELDRGEVELSPDLKFPLTVKGYFNWLESSGARAYILFEDKSGGLPKGIVFKRTSSSSDEVPCLCNWCHSVRARGQVRLLTASSNSKRLIGIHLCSDLSCKDKIEALPDPNDIHDRLSSQEERFDKVLDRISDFAAKLLY